jgi:hypothetical protein
MERRSSVMLGWGLVYLWGYGNFNRHAIIWKEIATLKRHAVVQYNKKFTSLYLQINAFELAVILGQLNQIIFTLGCPGAASFCDVAGAYTTKRLHHFATCYFTLFQ